MTPDLGGGSAIIGSKRGGGGGVRSQILMISISHKWTFLLLFIHDTVYQVNQGGEAYICKTNNVVITIQSQCRTRTNKIRFSASQTAQHMCTVLNIPTFLFNDLNLFECV